MDFSGKVALVTGAGSGIGKSAALILAGQGAFIGLLGRTADELHEALEEIRRAGGDGFVLVADVSDEAAMRDSVEALWNLKGRLDVVVANAGINGTWAPIEDLKPEESDQTIAVNLRVLPAGSGGRGGGGHRVSRLRQGALCQRLADMD